MSRREQPHTLDQLPSGAAGYYRESVSSALFDYELVGTDDAGRKVYQRYLDVQPWGQPRALLTYQEYKTAVKFAGKRISSIGVPRWTEPFYRNPRTEAA